MAERAAQSDVHVYSKGRDAPSSSLSYDGSMHSPPGSRDRGFRRSPSYRASVRRASEFKGLEAPDVWLKQATWMSEEDGQNKSDGLRPQHGVVDQPASEATRKLTAHVWDSVMMQSDPTAALREISRRSLMVDEVVLCPAV